MRPFLQNVWGYVEDVLHPAAGREVLEKKKKRATATPVTPKGSPDSQNIRELIKKQDGFRRNPAP